MYFVTLDFWFVKYSLFTYMMCYNLNVQFQSQSVKLKYNINKLQIHRYCDTWTTSLMLINCKYQMLIFIFHSQSIRCLSVVSLDTQIRISDLSCAILSIHFIYSTDVNRRLVLCFIFRTLCYQPLKIGFQKYKTTKNNLHATSCKMIVKLCFKVKLLGIISSTNLSVYHVICLWILFTIFSAVRCWRVLLFLSFWWFDVCQYILHINPCIIYVQGRFKTKRSAQIFAWMPIWYYAAFK